MTDQTLAVIADGVVVRVCELPDGLDPAEVFGAGTYVEAQAGVQLGWLYSDKGFSAPPAEPVAAAVPQVISDRQFFQQLAVDGDITEDEALGAVTTGTLPKKLADAIGGLPTDQQFPAKMLCCGATEFRRSNPVVAVLGAALQKDAAALDTIWTEASAL